MPSSAPKREEIDTALANAVILSWNELVHLDKARSIHVKYVCEPEQPISRVTVWAEKAGGYEDLVCECCARASVEHPGGTQFEAGWGSPILAQSLDFILNHQNLFGRAPDLAPHRLVSVDEPNAADRTKALEWFKSVESAEIEQLTKKSEHGQAK